MLMLGKMSIFSGKFKCSGFSFDDAMPRGALSLLAKLSNCYHRYNKEIARLRLPERRISCDNAMYTFN